MTSSTIMTWWLHGCILVRRVSVSPCRKAYYRSPSEPSGHHPCKGLSIAVLSLNPGWLSCNPILLRILKSLPFPAITGPSLPAAVWKLGVWRSKWIAKKVLPHLCEAHGIAIRRWPTEVVPEFQGRQDQCFLPGPGSPTKSCVVSRLSFSI